ncbi:IS110 family transposase [Streptomonospora halophila]
MTNQALEVTAGVDTHGQTHHAAIVDPLGRHLGDRGFGATAKGYRQLLSWLGSFGTVTAVGVEGTGAYGAELARVLRGAGLDVAEVDRPDRKMPRMKGKSDPIDACAAATAVASGRAAGTPKTRDGIVEAIRALRVARRGRHREAGEAGEGVDSRRPASAGPAGAVPLREGCGAGACPASAPHPYGSRCGRRSAPSGAPRAARSEHCLCAGRAGRV